MQRSGRRLEVSVLGHRYPVRAGGPTDEARAREVEDLLNARIEAIRQATGEISSLHLAVMAALSLADEALAVRDARARDRADDAAFRKTIRDRSERLLTLVDAELRARREATSGTS